MRVAIDTNTLISGICYPNGISAKALSKLNSGNYVLVLGDYMLSECERIMQEKFPSMILLFHEARLILAKKAEIIPISPYPYAEESLVPDEKDHLILRAALDGNAELLISGDKHFLQAKLTCIKVMSSRQFLRSPY